MPGDGAVTGRLPEGTEDLQFRDLQTMLAVAEAGSFRKASQSLHVGQSAITRRVQKLGNALGVSLFERRATGARLTVAGWAFAERARSILNDLHAAVGGAYTAGAGADGKLSVGLIASLSFGPFRNLVADYALRQSDVELVFVESERSELLTLLSHRILDVVMASGDFPDAHGDSEVLAEEPIYVALHEDDPLTDRERLSWDDVREARFLVSAAEPGPEIHEYLIRRLADLGRSPIVMRHRIGREGIMNLVGLGLGVSLVAEHWCGVSYPGVVFRPVGEEDERVRFSLVWRPENDNPALRRFVSLARVRAKKAAAGDAASRRPDPSP